MIYLDNNASTQLHPEIKKTLFDFLLSDYGNPSSPHSYGNFSRGIVEEARMKVANLLNTDPYHVIFTSSGSEANNMILKSSIINSKPRVIISSVEHSSIRKTCEYLASLDIEITTIPVDDKGIINLEILQKEIMKGASLVSIQWVNNETGVIQPLQQIIDICRKNGVKIHTDAAQALGKISIDLKKVDVDFLTITGHKVHALQGIGALYAKKLNSLVRMIHSGYEEYELRGGTENVLGILSFGKATELRLHKFEDINVAIKKMRDDFEQRLCNKFPEIRINGSVETRAGNTTNLLFPDIEGRALMAQLNRGGVICSQTSACTTQIPEPSHVLVAMGLSIDEAFASLRFSFSELNSEKDEIKAVEIIEKVYSRLKLMKDYF